MTDQLTGINNSWFPDGKAAAALQQDWFSSVPLGIFKILCEEKSKRKKEKKKHKPDTA